MNDLPPGVTIGPAPPELELEESGADYGWYGGGSPVSFERSAGRQGISGAYSVDRLDGLCAKPFACSGTVDSSPYRREASKFRAAGDGPGGGAYRVGRGTIYVALAEFVLTAAGVTGIVGRRGDHAVQTAQ